MMTFVIAALLAGHDLLLDAGLKFTSSILFLSDPPYIFPSSVSSTAVCKF